MELKGLTVNFLGDSITEGYGVEDVNNLFHQVIKEKHDLKYANNYGISGTRIARQHIPTRDSTSFDLTFELRADTMDRSADLVVVFGGTNDFGHGDAHFGEVDGEDTYTFCGAVNSLINKLSRDFPKAKIVFMTPLHRLEETLKTAPDSKTLEDYVEAIRLICRKRGINIIDLFEINPLDPADAELVPDGLHPSDKGHRVLARVVAEELLKL